MPKRPEDRRAYKNNLQDQLNNVGIQERFRRDESKGSDQPVKVQVEMPEGFENFQQASITDETESESSINYKLLIAAIIVAIYLTGSAVSGAIGGVEIGVPAMLFHAALHGNFIPLEQTISSLPVELSAGVGVYDTLLGSYIAHKLRRNA